MKTKLFLALALIVGVSIFSACGNNDEPGDGQWIDPVFARYLEKNGYIKDAVVVTPIEVSGITDLEISSDVITSLKGIEYFTSLIELKVSYCDRLNNIDLSRNKLLEVIYCFNNDNLSSINVNGCTELITLECWCNNLSQLNVTNNTKLEKLDCQYNNLSQLNLGNNIKLKNLDCTYNNLTQLDISKNTDLKYFTCRLNPGKNGEFRVKAWFDDIKDAPFYVHHDYWGDSQWKYIGGEIQWEFDDEIVNVVFYK